MKSHQSGQRRRLPGLSGFLRIATGLEVAVAQESGPQYGARFEPSQALSARKCFEDLRSRFEPRGVDKNPHHATGGEGGNHPKQTHLRTTPHRPGSDPPCHRKGEPFAGGEGGRGGGGGGTTPGSAKQAWACSPISLRPKSHCRALYYDSHAEGIHVNWLDSAIAAGFRHPPTPGHWERLLHFADALPRHCYAFRSRGMVLVWGSWSFSARHLANSGATATSVLIRSSDNSAMTSVKPNRNIPGLCGIGLG